MQDRLIDRVIEDSIDNDDGQIDELAKITLSINTAILNTVGIKPKRIIISILFFVFDSIINK